MAGARTKRAARLAKVFDIAELRDGETAMNRSWMTQRDGVYEWYWVPVGVSVHDASDLTVVSNFEVAERMLEAASDFRDVPDRPEAYPGTGDVRYRYDNWVGPTIKTLMVRADDAGALRVALEIRATLADYPVLSDADLSEREHEAMMDYWDSSERGDVQSLMVAEHEVPEDLLWPGEWRQLRLTEEEFDELAHGCEAWQEYHFDTALDMDALAEQVSAALRVKLCGEGADVTAHRECACCSQPCYGPVWTLCEGCSHDGECDAETAWHCTGEFGHACDGTACPQTQEEADADAEYQARREAERMMTPLF